MERSRDRIGSGVRSHHERKENHDSVEGVARLTAARDDREQDAAYRRHVIPRRRGQRAEEPHKRKRIIRETRRASGTIGPALFSRGGDGASEHPFYSTRALQPFNYPARNGLSQESPYHRRRGIHRFEPDAWPAGKISLSAA